MIPFASESPEATGSLLFELSLLIPSFAVVFYVFQGAFKPRPLPHPDDPAEPEDHDR